MSGGAAILVLIVVVSGLWGGRNFLAYRRESARPRAGDAGAYDGNLVIPVAGERNARPAMHPSHGSSHVGHSSAHHGAHVTHHGGHGVTGPGHH